LPACCRDLGNTCSAQHPYTLGDARQSESTAATGDIEAGAIVADREAQALQVTLQLDHGSRAPRMFHYVVECLLDDAMHMRRCRALQYLIDILQTLLHLEAARLVHVLQQVSRASVSPSCSMCKGRRLCATERT